MNLLERIEEAVANSYDIICAPQVYRAVRRKVDELEDQRDRRSIEAGRGPSMQRRIIVKYHAKQQNPLIMTFGDHIALMDHVNILDLARASDERDARTGTP